LPIKGISRLVFWVSCGCHRKPAPSTASPTQAGLVSQGRLQFADRITTVSPTYAREIQTESGGFGLDGLLRWRSKDLSGICNGIDVDVWNPQSDARIPSRFGVCSCSSRSQQAELQRQFELLESPDRLLFGVVSRLTWQKGLELLADALPTLIERGHSLRYWDGDHEMEQRWSELAKCLLWQDRMYHRLRRRSGPSDPGGLRRAPHSLTI